jgi:hypothetical protein
MAGVCVLLLQDLLQIWGLPGLAPIWNSCELRGLSCVCVYYCRTYDKAVCGGEGDSERHVL